MTRKISEGQPGKLWTIRFGIVSFLAFSLVAVGQSFVELSTSAPGLRKGSVSWGDYDNDGDLDLLLAGDTGSGSVTRIYRNDSGAFTDINASLPGISNGAALWADYDGDGWLDFALTGDGSAGRISRIYRNNSNGTFTDINAGLPGLQSSTLAWGDYDNDGDQDLFLTGYDGSSYVGKIYRNAGNDTFMDSGIGNIPGGSVGSAAWGDFDNDGDLDLIFAGFTLDTASGQSSRLYRNNNGTFTNVTSVALTAMSQCSVAWGDYDNDGDLDLLMAGSSISGVQSYPTVQLYRNNTSGASFTSINSGMTGVQHCSVAWGDYDNDGDLDVAIAGYSTNFAAQARVYVNLGSGFFFNTGASITPVIEAALAWVDYDGDNDLDLLLTGYDGTNAVTKLYRNDTFPANTAPSAPWGLNSSVSGKTVTLNWNAGSDANQSGGLSYNLRVGTTPGADNVFASMANKNTGFRRVLRLGNVNERLSWSLHLPVGGYYWSVQTIDHMFAGSGFDAEQYFQIPPQAPDVSTLPATNITLSSVTLPGTANPNGDATSFYFEYGTTTNYGNTTALISLGTGVTDANVSQVLSNLLPATTYQFRAVAANSHGTSYGTNRSFVTPTFVEVTNASFLGVGGGSIAWGDYDNDGFLDLLVAGGNSTAIVTRVYRNLSGTNFVEAVTNLAGINNGTVAWGDYDNDSDLDVLLTGNSTSRVYRNDGNSVFTDLNLDLPGLGTGASAQWADMDNDGDLDFVLTGGGSTTVRLSRNDGNDQFASVTNSLPPVNDSALAWADYDTDGDLDLLMTGYNFGAGGISEMTRLYRNNGRGTLTYTNLAFQSLNRSAVSWGDYDNDGDLDLLLCGAQFSTRYSMIYSNRGVGTFASVTISAVPKVDQGNISWGDYDSDGDLDILIVGQASTGAVARVFRNDTNAFRDSGAVLPTFSSVRAGWGDYDNDGRLDILMMGYTGSNYVTKLFRSYSLNANAPPTPPNALTATVTNNAVILGWGAATDANQSGGLTYNLRIGTAPGLSDVLGPMASGLTGFRRLPKLGNANLRQTWTITNLVVGTYYWSVQAVDHAYAGSAFSTNGSFTITAALLPPIAVTKPATNISLASVALQGFANARGATTTTFFQYGTTTNFGSLTALQNIGSGTTNVSLAATVANLNDGTTYYFRVAASNINGTAFGATLSFTTGFQFSNVVMTLPGFGSGGTAWGDYDNDGDLDLALNGRDVAGTHVYGNNGNGLFTPAATNLPGAGYGGLEWGDYDNDGDLDLLTFGESAYKGPAMWVTRNDGNGLFTTIATFAEGLFGYSFATWVDYDSDGDLDISCYDAVLQNQAYAYSRIYRNDGGAFVPSGVPMPRMTWGGMAWGDFDQDGDPDLAISGQFIITNYIVPTTRIYRNDGYGVLTNIEAGLVGLEYGSLAWGDYDNDGDLDLLCVGRDSSSSLRTILYRNDNGTFVDANAGLPGSNGAMGWVDYDNDGDLDLHLNFDGSYYSTNRIYRNDGNGVFANSGKYFLGSMAYYVPIAAVTWGDYDRDGDLDVLVNSALYQNNNLLADSVPGTPTGLSLLRTGNVATLRWNAPTDPNQSGGLSYNLQVGTSPGNYDILAPAAESSGWRRLPKPGIASHPVWKLVLPVGTYYWQVQAIDHTQAGSAFSSESSFTIPVQLPMSQTLSGTTNADSYPRLNGLVNPNGLPTTVYFDFGTTTNFGSRTPAQFVGGGTAGLPVSADLNSLLPEQIYFYRFVASNSLGVAYGVMREATQYWFTDRAAATLPPGASYPRSWADFDQDGDLELFAYNNNPAGNAVFRNDGGIFTNLSLFFNLVSTGDANAWGDYDSDGDLDVVMLGTGTNGSYQILLFRNDGSNQATKIILPMRGVDQGPMTWADLDEDGDLDLIVTGIESGRIHTQVCINEGNDLFVKQDIGLPNVYAGAAACADYDQDGRVDVLLMGATNYNTRICKLFHNDGNLTFSDSGANFPAVEGGAATWGDFDNDGDLDLLINGWDTGTNYFTRVFRNDDGTFADVNAGLPGLYGGSTWFDYDNDGKLDIFLTGTPSNYFYLSSFTRIYRNAGGGTFTNSGLQLPQPGDTRSGIFLGDYDGDGDLDVLLPVRRLLRNEGRVTNSAPTVPVGLSASVAANSATLRWKNSSDADQFGGLTYNVRVGNLPGDGNIMSGAALPDGRRLLPELGNAYSRTNLTLRDLKVGTYYWTVQAIDHGKVGSPFATNGSFVIPAQAPSIYYLSHSNLLATGVTLAGRVNPNAAATAACYEYGLSTNYGSQSPLQNLGNGTNQVPVVATLAGLNLTTTYHYRLVASNSFGASYGPDRVFTTPQFSLVDIGLPASSGAFGPGDDDNDGDLDFVMAIPNGLNTLLFHNNGSATFTANGGAFPAVNGALFDWGDYDRDGDLDLLMAAFSSAGIYRNDGNATFANINAGLPSGWGTMRWGDCDNDGDLDVLISTGGSTRVYRNNTGSFALAATPATAGGFAVWGDYDRDSDLDFVFTGVDGNGNPVAQLIRNDGGAGFANSGVALANLFGQAAWGDYDNDGNLDLLLCGSTNNHAGAPGFTKLYRNNGNGTFTETPTTLPNLKANLLWADYDNDGDLDVLRTGLINWASHAGVYRNDANGVFTDIGAGLIPVAGDGLACGDFDNDGDLDLLLSGYDSEFVYLARLYRNNNNASNSPPNAPAGLTATMTSNGIALSWSPALDANQMGGLSYNLRVGTVPGAGNIVSPSAASNGWQRVPRMGNVQQNLHWSLINLPAGTYYWSVQAVDNSFAGSTFAPEQSFFANSRPVANSQLIVMGEDTLQAITLSATDTDGQSLAYAVISPTTNGILTGTLPNLFYRPNTNVFGSDRFVFQAGDGFTNSAPATVSLIVTQVLDVAGSTLAIQKQTNGQPRLTVVGEPFEHYRLEASDDLIHWVALTNVISSNGIMAVIDTDSAYFPRRFYRAVLDLPIPTVGSPRRSSAGAFQFDLAGELARRYRVEASTNLAAWTTLTNVLLTTSPIVFTDPAATNYPRRFYRVRPVQ